MLFIDKYPHPYVYIHTHPEFCEGTKTAAGKE